MFKSFDLAMLAIEVYPKEIIKSYILNFSSILVIIWHIGERITN